jgi:hypothetical protein
MPPRYHLARQKSYRIIPSRFPPTGLFDRVADPADLEAVFELEAMTNDRLRGPLECLRTIPAARRISGAGSTPVMAAFTHPNTEGSRFSDGSYGVFYAALQRATAIRETVYHRERFLQRTAEPACRLEMRCYVATLEGSVDDIRGGFPALHAADSYAASQAWAIERRSQGSDGVIFDSVRHPGGQCVAAYYPDLVRSCTQQVHLVYDWDGSRIGQVFVARDLMTID